MTADIIDPDYQWKQAASQEGVDYGAVQKAFMDQSYAVVANKAKILFQDPFRLGFEIVHRNEKATKMVGIYAFRVNENLLYAPVFFVNGEIKAADMLYRADVKRFVPLSEEWCAYLVRGVHENSGEVVNRNRVRQADAYMDRLAYPQRVKYASDAEDKEGAEEEASEHATGEERTDEGKSSVARTIGRTVTGTLGGAAGLAAGATGALGAEALNNSTGNKVSPTLLKIIQAALMGGGLGGGAHLGREMIAKKASDETFSAHIESFATDVFINFKHVGKSATVTDLRKMAEAEAAAMEAARDAFVKAAADDSLWQELLQHSADSTPLRKLLPLVINENGPEALEKLAAIVDSGSEAAKFVATHYTKAELETVDGWLKKEASGPSPAISIILSPALAKSAAQRENIFDKGYDLVDHRLDESVNTVTEEVGDGTIKELSSPGKVRVLMADGSEEEALLLRLNARLLEDESGPTSICCGSDTLGKPEFVFFPSTKELFKLPAGEDIFGDEMIDQDTKAKAVTGDKLSKGKCYAALDTRDLAITRPFCVEDVTNDGDCSIITIADRWGEHSKLYYAPGRGETSGRYLSDETFFLEVNCDVTRDDRGPACIEPKCTKFPMASRGVDQWIRTAGGITTANEVTVKPKAGPTFDIEHRENGTLLKAARDLGWLEAHLKLAEDFSLRTDKAGEILSKAADRDVTYRIFDSITKSAYLTRPEGMQQWIQSFDPEMNVQLDAPQQQILSTHTPRRPDQQSRYGDVYQGARSKNSDTAESLLPMDAIMNNSPEQLAQMAQMYDLPHIFDHGCVSQMATSSHNIVEQIKRYIPDMESGVDRWFRTLFLLRYRPADFEELYGKDELLEYEQDLAELAARSGETLLRMLQRFNADQYAPQEN